MAETFHLKTEKFEGPLDLLLHLIEEKKLHISEVSLAQVTDDYIAYLSSQKDISKKNMADFLIIASTLMFIKSVALLPTIEQTEEETQSIEELKRRLTLYKRFKDLSLGLKELYGQSTIYFREENKNIEPVFTPTKEITLANLNQLIKGVLQALPKPEKVPEAIVKKIISLETVIKDLTKRIESSLRLKFSEFIGDKKAEKINIVVSFLGMLELVRQGIIEVNQGEPFTDIDMETKSANLPRYL